jgi:RHH-type rel operon transcriptional repressor/antitoxin RelB
MPAVSLRLPEELKTRLAHLSERTGRSKTYYMIEAIKEHISELEALYIAEQRLIKHRAGRSKSYTQKEMEKLIAISENAKEAVDLWGAMRGTVRVAPGVDLTEPTGEIWDAEL